MQAQQGWRHSLSEGSDQKPVSLSFSSGTEHLLFLLQQPSILMTFLMTSCCLHPPTKPDHTRGVYPCDASLHSVIPRLADWQLCGNVFQRKCLNHLSRGGYQPSVFYQGQQVILKQVEVWELHVSRMMEIEGNLNNHVARQPHFPSKEPDSLY